MGNDPFFSVIIPVYQAEKSLRYCVESVLNQEDGNCEVILVDDGSTDLSGKLCDLYQEAYPEIISVLHQENAGPLLARINGIRAARGQFIMFLDSDDSYLPGIFKRIRNAIQTYSADLVIFNYYKVYSETHMELHRPLYQNEQVFEGLGLPQLYSAAVSGKELNSLWQKCASRNLLYHMDRFQVYGKMLLGEDKLLSLEMIGNADKVLYIEDGLYGYHVLPGSLSHSLTLRHYRDMEIVHLKCLEYISRWKLNDCLCACCLEKIDFGLSCLYAAAENELVRRGNARDFIELAQHVRADPFFWQAYSICKQKLEFRKRFVCELLRRGLIKLILFSLMRRIQLKTREFWKLDGES